MDSLQQLSDKLDLLREELGNQLMTCMIYKRDVERMLAKANEMREKIDILQIEQDRKEVSKW